MKSRGCLWASCLLVAGFTAGVFFVFVKLFIS